MTSLNPAQLERYLKGVNYPVSKAELVKHMDRCGADESISSVISCLPNQSYDSPSAINRAISALQQESAQQGNVQQGNVQQGNAQQDQERPDYDRNHQDQSQQGRQQRAGR